MTPDIWAEKTPTKLAVVEPNSGLGLNFSALARTSLRWANVFRSRGLHPGSRVAILSPNTPLSFCIYWAALRSGLRFVPLNWNLTPEETDYILRDSGAEAIIAHVQFSDLATQLVAQNEIQSFAVGGLIPDFESLERLALDVSDEAPEREIEGSAMLYSSGTTGRPKGIIHELPEQRAFGDLQGGPLIIAKTYRLSEKSVYLCPAPIYHAAPLIWSLTTMRLGGSVVLMSKFDGHGALQAMHDFDVTVAQFVPTHLIRMLKLPDTIKSKYDLPALQTLVHAAAPCPVDVKQAMIDWLGPRIFEYYSGSEGAGMTSIDSEAWLKRPGSVGRATYGEIHILDEDGEELPPGEIGAVYFSGGRAFQYHNDSEKTASTRDAEGRSTLGDLGYLDEDGYLFLASRRSDLILSGGVNIYPREAEDRLIMHPGVDDVAVIGRPHDEMGQSVHAIIVAAPGYEGDGFDTELDAFCRDHLAGYKCPRSFEFVQSLPRMETGKLRKHELK